MARRPGQVASSSCCGVTCGKNRKKISSLRPTTPPAASRLRTGGPAPPSETGAPPRRFVRRGAPPLGAQSRSLGDFAAVGRRSPIASAIVASVRAWSASVLARRPWERAKHRTGYGLIVYSGSPAFSRASSKSRWKDPADFQLTDRCSAQCRQTPLPTLTSAVTSLHPPPCAGRSLRRLRPALQTRCGSAPSGAWLGTP